MRDKLTPKQQAFADYYIECGNAAEAARRAGYKCAEQQGKENIRKPTIAAYIADRTRPTAEKRIATGDEVMEFFTRVMKGEVKDAIPTLTGEADINQINNQRMCEHAMEEMDMVLLKEII